MLVSTTIVESGLDIPTANTMIVQRADRFGLAQLYQLRGRVGRAKIARLCLLITLPADTGRITERPRSGSRCCPTSTRLGAGFQLASHDLDIRGAGNLLGDEQSGHMKEVGFELYQSMLEEAMTDAEGGTGARRGTWSPPITTDAPMNARRTTSPTWRCAWASTDGSPRLESEVEIDTFAAEMIDRFGPLPPKVGQLMKLAAIKALCRRAHAEKVEAGPKGVIISFRDNSFADPQGLVRYVTEQGASARFARTCGSSWCAISPTRPNGSKARGRFCARSSRSPRRRPREAAPRRYPGSKVPPVHKIPGPWSKCALDGFGSDERLEIRDLDQLEIRGGLGNVLGESINHIPRPGVILVALVALACLSRIPEAPSSLRSLGPGAPATAVLPPRLGFPLGAAG